MSIAGHATSMGTISYSKRQSAASNHFREYNNLLMSSIGIGTYLGSLDEETDRLVQQAIIQSISNGINVIDTAINYRYQRSERIVGKAIRQAIAQRIAAREELIVCSKGGFVPSPNRVEWFKENYVDPSDSSIQISDLVGQSNCIHPDYIRDQLRRSLENLGLETIDIYYLHNPEIQLSDVTPDIFYERIKAAFTVLEEMVEAGKIMAYGLATWDAFRVPSTHRAHINLAKVKAIAENITSEKSSHFKFIQFPINALMLECMVQKYQSVEGHSVSIIQACQKLGITPVVSSSLGQGRALEKTLPLTPKIRQSLNASQFALQFARSVPNISMALVGMKTPEYVTKNIELVSLPPLQKTTMNLLLDEFKSVK